GLSDTLTPPRRLTLGDFEGASPRRRLGDFRPRPGLIELGGAGDQEINDNIGEIAHWTVGAHLDREVVDLSPSLQPRIAGPGNSRALRLELLSLRVEEPLQVPNHGVGIEVRAVVELHAATQREGPARGVRLVLHPLL